jgi:hypothetical protein
VRTCRAGVVVGRIVDVLTSAIPMQDRDRDLPCSPPEHPLAGSSPRSPRRTSTRDRRSRRYRPHGEEARDAAE